MKAEIKGVIVSNEDKWVYEMLGMDSTCPKDVLTQLEFSDEDVDIIINSNGGNLVAGSEIYTHLSCLLYTSPSPRDQRGSRMPSSA